MQTGKARIIPVVLLDKPDGDYWETWMKFLTQHLYKIGFISEADFYFFKITHDVEATVKEITGFYRIYHSARWVGVKLVIRIAPAITPLSAPLSDDTTPEPLRRRGIDQGNASGP